METLFAELERIRNQLDAPRMTMEEISSLQVPDDQSFRQVFATVGANYVMVRLVRNREGSPTVNVDLTIPRYRLTDQYRRTRERLGLILCESIGIMDCI